jgi:hypothetical protein
MKAAEELSMFEDRHYKLAAERVVGLASASADNMTLEKVRGACRGAHICMAGAQKGGDARHRGRETRRSREPPRPHLKPSL